MDNEHPNYYAIIPANVRYDNELSASEKIFYGEITALANKNGYCWASNTYFSELYDVSKVTISRWVANLKEKGYIHTKIKYIDGTRQIEKRLIYISDPINKNVNTYTQKSGEGINKNVKTPINKNVKDNNTSINNTSINKERPKSQERYSDDSPYMELSKRLLSHIRKRNPKHKEPNLQKWSDDFRKLVEIDKREITEVKQVIDWCQSNDFWQNNVLSADKVRKHFDRFYLEINKSNFVADDWKENAFEPIEHTEEDRMLFEEMKKRRGG